MPRQVKPADVAGGRVGLDNYLTDATTKDTLTQAWDNDVAARRAGQSAAQFASQNPAQQGYFDTFNNMQEDSATGRSGYNRQWVPLLQSLKGKNVNMAGSGLPTETYADPTQSGHMTRQSDDEIAALRSKARPMPLGHEAFLHRLYGSDPPDLTPPALPAATPPAAATLLPQQPPLGAVAALARQLRSTS